MAKILIVEDEPAINSLLSKNLALVGHQCKSCFNGLDALEELQQQNFDLLVLDIMLPGLDGFEVYARHNTLPTIFLTARDDTRDKVRGLNMGADDYLAKPFEMLEFLARVNAILRRTQKRENSFVLNDILVDFIQHTVYKADTLVEMTPKEFELLEALIINRNIALSRDRLLEIVWEYDYCGDTRTIDVHIQKLRKKLGLEENIITVYKLGYRLEVPHEK